MKKFYVCCTFMGFIEADAEYSAKVKALNIIAIPPGFDLVRWNTDVQPDLRPQGNPQMTGPVAVPDAED